MTIKDTDAVNELNDECPGCRHLMRRHTIEYGCEADWVGDDEGCRCGLSLALQWGPTSERGNRRYS